MGQIPRLLRPSPSASPSASAAELLLRFDGNFNDEAGHYTFRSLEGAADTVDDPVKFGESGDLTTAQLLSNEQVYIAPDEDFTLEMWNYSSYCRGDGAAPMPVLWSIDPDDNTMPASSLGLSLHDNSRNLFLFNNGYLTDGYHSTDPICGEWQHIAVVRSSGSISTYIDGVMAQSVPHTAAITGYLRLFPKTFLGDPTTLSHYGFVDDVRLVKGLAVYRGDFTPPTAPLTLYARQVPVEASLLLHCDGTNGSTAFTDSSVNALTVTAWGNAEISTAESKWGGASMYVADSATDGVEFHFDATEQLHFPGDYTIECWLYRVSGSSDTSLYVSADASNAHAINIDGSQFNLYFNTISPSATIPHSIGFGAWTHVAFVRSGGVFTVYVNGVAAGTAAAVGTHGFPNPVLARTGGGGTQEMYIDDYRITKGVAVYRFPFTPPTGPLPAIATPQPIQAQASLLLHFDGTNGSTAFTDSSQNALTVTANGDAEISTAQSKWGGASGYFDADTGTYASISSFPGFDGAGDFTIEMWIYANTITPWQPLLGTASSASGDLQFALNPDGDDTDGIGLGQQNVAYFTASPAGILLNTWHHIACVRSGNTLRYFVDGTQVGSDIDVTGQTFPIGDLYIANHNIGATEYPFNGYIDDLRIVNGLAVYTGPFAPPTGPLPAIATPQPIQAQASLLLHFDGTNETQTFTDSSTNNHSIAYTGTAELRDTQARFGDTSLYLDGSGSTLEVPQEGAVSGTGDWTVEMWAWPEPPPFPDSNPYAVWIASDTSSGWSSALNTNGTVTFGESLVGTLMTTSNAVVFGAWNHVAWCRKNGKIKIFINGIEGAIYSYPNDIPAGVMRVGSDGGQPSFLNYVGYIDDFRIVRGLAVYTANFTPPESPLTAAVTRWPTPTPLPVAPNPPVVQSSLLLHFDGANESTTFTDSSVNALALTAYGTAEISTAQNQWGGSSAYFDGSALVTGGTSPLVAFGTGDFTVEAWVYVNDPVSYGAIFSSRASDHADDANAVFLALLDAAPILHTDVIALQGTIAVANDTWTHIAWVRKDGVLTIYVDGVSAGSAAFTTDLTADDITIGGEADTGQTKFVGYIDDLRIVKGLAVYTSNFTPPAAPLTKEATRWPKQ